MNDAEFIEAFEACTLEPFHHADHIRAGWIYLERHPTLEAITKFTAGLKRFAQSKGAPQLYHETITWAYLLLINQRRLRTPDITTWPAFRENNPDLLTWKPGILDTYYDPATLASPLARAVFLMPNAPSRSLA